MQVCAHCVSAGWLCGMQYLQKMSAEIMASMYSNHRNIGVIMNAKWLAAAKMAKIISYSQNMA
jgi:hypothetical protein